MGMADNLGQLRWEDVERVVRARAANLVSVVLKFLKESPAPPREVPEEALTEKKVLKELENIRKEKRLPAEKRPDREGLFARWQAQVEPAPPERLKFAELLVELDSEEDPLARGALLSLTRELPLIWGPFAALKRVYKKAEERWDIELFSAISWRFDTALADLRRRNSDAGEIRQATLAYLARRSWRFLRKVGHSMPELYPSFAAEVLQHYQDNTPWEHTWVANQIFYHRAPGARVHRMRKAKDPKTKHFVFKQTSRVKRIYDKKKFLGPFPRSVTQSLAFAEAWSADSAPLFRLVEAARSDRVLTFAIELLEKHFAEELRRIPPELLLRWGSRPNPKLHLFVVSLLEKNAAVLPPGRFREVGLHPLMLAFLESPQPKVRAFAISYAQGYAQDLPAGTLMRLLREGFDDVKRFVVESLARRRGAELGLPLLKDLLAIPLTNAMAAKKLREDFDKSALNPDWLKDLLLSGQRSHWEFAQGYLDKEYTPQELTAFFYAGLLDDERLTKNLQRSEYRWIVRYSLDRLATLPPDMLGALGAQWAKDALVREELRGAVRHWITTGIFPPRVLGVEYFQSLVFNESLVSYAFEILRQDAFSPKEIGVTWCFGILRDERAWLHEKAAELLSLRFQPEDFDPEGALDNNRSFSALWRRAVGEAGGAEDRPWVRSFAQRYLMSHHPEIAKKEEGKETGARAKEKRKTFPRELYDSRHVLSRVEDVTPSQKDPSDLKKDVSFFAQSLVRLELRRWLDASKEEERDAIMGRLFELSDHASVNVRRFAYSVLAGGEEESKGYKLSAMELCAYPDRVYTLTESRYLGTRQLGEHLIGAHYEELGGPKRVLSLAESVERDVIDFATKLLFRHHQLATTTAHWQKAPPPAISRRAGMYERPDAAATVIREVRPGRWLRLLEDQGDWLRVEDGGVEGWLREKDIRPRLKRPQPMGPEALSAKEALLEFFRRVLFRLPPGRRPQAKGQKSKGVKEATGSAPWSARFESNRTVKRHVIALARDIALQDQELAEPIADLLRPFVRSTVAGEARASLAALVRLSQAHGLSLRLEGVGEGGWSPGRRKSGV